jgi:hypothetical protein
MSEMAESTVQQPSESNLPTNATESILVGKTVQLALTENRKRLGEGFAAKLQEAGGRETITSFVDEAWKRMMHLEDAARHPKDHLPKTQEEAASIKVLWDISGAGTYFEPKKDDPYHDKSWAEWADKKRWKYTEGIYKYLTNMTGDKTTPQVIYNGRPDEIQAVSKAFGQGLIKIPQDNVHMIDDDNYQIGTAGQARSPQFKQALIDLGLQSDDTIGIVVSGPQAVRLMHMVEQFKTFPEGVKARIFPLPTPGTGLTEYHEQEVKGLVYYTFFANPPSAAKTPYPYTC